MYESLQAQAAFLKLNAQGLYLREVQAAFANLGVRHLASISAADCVCCFYEAAGLTSALLCCLAWLHLLATQACFSACGLLPSPSTGALSGSSTTTSAPHESQCCAALPCSHDIPWYSVCYHAMYRRLQLPA